MNLNEWAIKHNIPFDAVEDLRRQFGAINTDPLASGGGESESLVQTKIRLEATGKNCRLWRNNVGATYTDDGRFLRYGLANDSARMNGVIKSSDLIGIRPLLIQPHHVGGVIGQFMAREVKPQNWRYSATKREQAQLKFLELVLSMGGDACFANSEGTI